MTELQRQVRLLQSQNAGAQANPLTKGRASLFLNTSEAAALDFAVVLEAAQNGLQTLNQYDGRFGGYLESLLHPSSVSLQRELKTKEENAGLDKDLHSLLSLLSLYASQAATHKVLEYLIQRYKVHELNSTGLLRCLLCIHDTKIFARAVQLTTIEGGIWSFLEGVKRTGTPLPREVLVKKIARNVNLLAELCKLVKSAVKLCSAVGVYAESSTVVGAERIVSFFTACVVEMVHSAPMEDMQVRQLYPVLVDGFRSSANAFSEDDRMTTSGQAIISLQFLRSSCMIVAQMSRLTPFAQPLILNLITLASRAFVHGAASSATSAPESHAAAGCLEIVMTLAVLAQQQRVVFTNDALEALFFDYQSHATASSSYFLETLRAIHLKLDASELITSLVSGLGEFLIRGDCGDINSATNSSPPTEAATLRTLMASRLLCSMIASGILRENALRLIIGRIISIVGNDSRRAGMNKDTVEQNCTVLRKIAQRYPNLFDGAIDELLQAARLNGNATISEASLRKFLSSTFVDAPYHVPSSTEGGLSLLLSLRSPAPSVRIEALRNFGTTVPLDGASARDIIGLAEAALHCLTDNDLSVAEAAWNAKVVSRVAKYSDSKLLSEACSVSLDTWVDMTMRDAKCGCNMLSLIFVALSEPLVVQAISPHAEYLSGVLISHSLGLAAAVASTDSSDNTRDSCKLVEAAAFACAVKCGTHLPLLSRLDTTNSRGSDPSERLAKAVALYLKDGAQDSSLDLLAMRAHSTLNQGSSVTEKRSAQLITHMLCDASSFLARDGSKSSNELWKLFALLSPLLLQMISSSLGSSAECQTSLKGAVGMLTRVLEDSKKAVFQETRRQVTKKSSGAVTVSDALGHFLADGDVFDKEDFRLRLLRALLALAHPSVAPLVGLCLNTFYPSQKMLILVQIAMNGDSANEPVFPVLVDGAKARAGALFAISALLQGGFEATEDHENTNLLLVALLLSAVSCCDREENVRRGGIALAATLAKGSHNSVSKAELELYGEIVSRSASTIIMDSAAAVALFGTEIFGKTTGAVIASLRNTLFSVLSAAAWYIPGYVAPVMASAAGAAAANDAAIKHLELVFLPSLVPRAANVDPIQARSLSKALLHCFSNNKAMKSSIQESVSKTFCSLITREATGCAESALRIEIMDTLAKGWASSLVSPQAKKEIFEVLVREQMRLPGQTNVLAAIEHTPVDKATLISIVQTHVSGFKELLGRIPQNEENGADEAMDIDSPSSDTFISGVSVQLQASCSLFEGISQTVKILAQSAESAGAVGTILSSVMDLFALLNNQRFRAVLSVEYCKSIIMDLVYICVSTAGQSIIDGTRKTKSSSAAPETTNYHKGRISGDIKSILKCLSLARSVTVQTSALNLVQVLAALDPSSITAIIDILGTFLSSSTEGLWQGGKDEILKKVLSSLVAIVSNCERKSLDHSSASQNFLQPLCLHLRTMPSHRRSSLVKMALGVLGDSSLPLCVFVLLAHSYSAYEFDQIESHAQVEADSGASFVLLSRAAQRRAFRSMKTSQPEEMFDLAIEIAASRPAVAQVCNMLAVIKATVQLLEVASSPAALRLQPLTVVLPTGSTTVDIAKLQSFQEKIAPYNVANGDSERQGSAAALAMLFLEFLHEHMENKSFHRSLAQLLDAPNSSFKAQEGFVELSDHLLQLLALAMQLQQHDSSEKISVRMGSSTHNLSIKALGNNVSDWCLDILKSLQRLLDAPAFVSILQELIDHENPSVRQAALHILGQRLEKLHPKRSSDEEKVLLLDLLSHLRGAILEAVPKRGVVVPSVRSNTNGLAQSAIMCVDVLASHFGKSREWATPLFDYLSEMTSFSTAIHDLIKNSNPADQKSYAGELKLLAASFLSCGTLTRAVGPKALPMLSALMTNLLGILETQGKQVAAFTDDAMDFDGDEEDEARSPQLQLWRSLILLLRSAITAIGAIVAELHSFFHPYLQRILLSVLALHDFGGGSQSDRLAMTNDVDRCLTLLASRIPPRLSSPALLQAAPQVLVGGHTVARRFAQLLAETYSGLDRPAVVAHMTDLCEMSALVLDYRRVYGDNSSDSIAAEAMVVETVVCICLKLTETELKQLLGRLGEWRDSKEASKRNGPKGRAVSFYQLLAALGLKLKAILVPCVGPFWQVALGLLGDLSTISSESTGDSGSASKSKKRRLSNSASLAHETGARDGRDTKEYTKIAMAVLDCIRVTCLHDEGDFIDEPRYIATIGAVGPLVSASSAFETDEDYLDFIQRCLSPCLVALAHCAKRDTLWKPMIHNLLMATRHSRSVVRLAALRAVHNLFVKVSLRLGNSIDKGQMILKPPTRSTTHPPPIPFLPSTPRLQTAYLLHCRSEKSSSYYCPSAYLSYRSCSRTTIPR